MRKKPQNKWARFNIELWMVSTYPVLRDLNLPKESYKVVRGAILFETEAMKQKFVDAYYRKGKPNGTPHK